MNTLKNTLHSIYVWTLIVVSFVLLPVTLLVGIVVGFLSPSFRKWFNDSINDQPNDGATMIVFWPAILLDTLAHPLALFFWKCPSCKSWWNTNNLDRCDACGVYI